MTLSPKLRAALTVVAMFLPVVGYSLGDWLIAHWAVAKQLDVTLKPYAFNAAMLIGLVIGLAQTAWIYWRKRQWSSYTLQQLVLLLVSTLIPLRFGHFVHGLSIFGLIGLGVAAAYGVDAIFKAPLFIGFAKHFSPQYADKFDENPYARRVVVHIELGFVLVMTVQNLFVLFGNLYLPKTLYLLVLPFYAKALWGGYMAFAFTYPRWLVKRYRARQAANAEPMAEAA